uniref:RNA polymerase n=1 Tax=Desmarestia aculeata TaxID=62298 RepID=A0A8F0K156_9PHAE|nr:RNA polymerase [Desmarestia aculeata]
MSLFCSNKNGLRLTNVFNKKNYDEEDIYKSIHNGVVEKFPILDQMTRKEYKAIIMKLSYGEGNQSRSEDIKDYYRRLDISTKSSGIASPYKITAEYPSSLYNKFPSFKLLKKQIDIIIAARSELNLPINLNISAIYKTTQYYNMDKAITYTFRGYDNTSKKIKMYIPENELYDKKANTPKRFEAKVNKNKMLRATMPNLIHYLDAIALQHVTTRFREENKPLFTVHDEFYVRLCDIHFTKMAYFNALKQIYDDRPWFSILDSNKILDYEIDLNNMKEKMIQQTLNDLIKTFKKSIPENLLFEEMNDNILK